MLHYRSRCFFALVALSVFMCACSIRQDFSYVPEAIEELPHTRLKIAVLPFVDNREVLDSGSTGLAWVPGVPTSAKTVDAPQDLSDRNRPVYYFPDLVAYGLALDLIRNNVGSIVHFDPEVKDDYDLVIDGSIDSLAKTNRRITYGLGPAAFALYMFGIPALSKSVDFKASYRVKLPGGDNVFFKEYDTDWGTALWGGSSIEEGERNIPLMEGINSTIRESNTQFLTDAAPVISSQALKSNQRDRLWRFYTALDPELRVLEIELQRLGRGNELRRNRVSVEISKRERILEKYRQAEEQILAKQQQYIFQVQEARLQHITQLRSQTRVIEERQRQLEQAAAQQQNRAIAGALLAGMVPAYNSAATAGDWSSAQSAMMAQDIASGLSAVPPPPPPPPDLSPYLRQLDVSFDGLESGGNLLAGIRGSSLQEIRQKFLRAYRGKITPLGQM